MKQVKKESTENRIKMIIDSDVSNEIDDQFAISYALARQDKFDILAITLAPFRVSWQRGLSISDGLVDSKNETYRILRLFGMKYTTEEPFVFMGSNGFISEGYNSSNPAVDRIIELAKEHENLYICCLGTLTNVAMALKIAPEITKNLKVVWIGTDNILLDEFTDSNYSKDKDAFYEVIKSKIDFTIFPSSLARNFVTSIYEFSNNLRANNLVKYLQSLLIRSYHSEKENGIKEIFDIGPVAFLLYPEKFITKQIDAKLVVKDKGQKVARKRKVNYIIKGPKHFEIWNDFLMSVNSVKNYYLKPQIFFISDTHFGQESKVRTKQVIFKSVEEMDKELVRRWNCVVAKNDTVYHIGDFGDYNFIKKLNGRVILICGNYEKREMGNNFEEFRNKLKKMGFVEVYENGLYLDEKIFGKKVYLTHKPSDHAKDCKTLFGHVHTLAPVKKFGFNVCCTYHNYTPINLSTAKRYINFVETSADNEVFS